MRPISLRTTHTYKCVEGHDIHLDVYTPDPPGPKPAVFFIHGGALIFGDRESVFPGQVEYFTDQGFVFVSIDYRLAPETKLPDIISDVTDAWQWVHGNAAALQIDARRIVAAGYSAGGYLALVGGFQFHPAPRAVASFYGYGDLTGPWYTEPDLHYMKAFEAVPEALARTGIGTTLVSGAPLAADFSDPRARFYLYARQTGRWTELVGGRSPEKRAWFAAFEPVRNVTSAYPPTMLLHGEADTDVPVEQSVLMAAELEANGVDHELVVKSHWTHAFDMAGPGVPDVAAAYARVLTFFRKQGV